LNPYSRNCSITVGDCMVLSHYKAPMLHTLTKGSLKPIRDLNLTTTEKIIQVHTYSF